MSQFRETRPKEKEELFLCMGSACHQLGVFEVLPIVQQLLRDHGLETTVELKGAFCLERCGEGISLKHRDRVVSRINPRNVADRFVEEILPSLRQSTGGGKER